MRRRLDPPPFIRCTVCRGELLLKCIKAESVDSDADIAIYHCERCGHELTHLLAYSPYNPHDANWDMPAIGNS
jgi:hypothetical protein